MHHKISCVVSLTGPYRRDIWRRRIVTTLITLYVGIVWGRISWVLEISIHVEPIDVLMIGDDVEREVWILPEISLFPKFPFFPTLDSPNKNQGTVCESLSLSRCWFLPWLKSQLPLQSSFCLLHPALTIALNKHKHFFYSLLLYIMKRIDV